MSHRPSAAELNGAETERVPSPPRESRRECADGLSGSTDVSSRSRDRSRELAGSRSPVSTSSSRRRDRDRDHDRRSECRDSYDDDRRRRGDDRDRRPRSRSRSPPRRRRYDDDDDRYHSSRSRRRDDYDDDRRGGRYSDERDRRPRRRSRSRSPPPQSDVDKAKALAAEPRRSVTPELTEEQHEMRSVFVAQLAARVDDRALRAFFEMRCGKVREAKVIVDRVSRRSKGVGYVEFAEIESVAKAISLTGQILLGIPVFVQLTESEKNRRAAASSDKQANIGPFVPIGEDSDARPDSQVPNNRIYAGSLAFDTTEQQLKAVFEPFGQVDFCEIGRDEETNKSRGFGFVQCVRTMHRQLTHAGSTSSSMLRSL